MWRGRKEHIFTHWAAFFHCVKKTRSFCVIWLYFLKTRASHAVCSVARFERMFLSWKSLYTISLSTVVLYTNDYSFSKCMYRTVGRQVRQLIAAVDFPSCFTTERKKGFWVNSLYYYVISQLTPSSWCVFCKTNFYYEDFLRTKHTLKSNGVLGESFYSF